MLMPNSRTALTLDQNRKGQTLLFDILRVSPVCHPARLSPEGFHIPLRDSRGQQFLNGNAQHIAENGDFFIRDAPDARFDPGENVPAQVPSHPLTPGCKLSLRLVEMISRLAHLLANQIAFPGMRLNA